jgi:tetratricopeptide (TPR) repeat protein
MRIQHWLLCFVFVLGAGRVAADEDPSAEARAQYRQGVALYDEGRFAQAAIAFERAYELRPQYRILWNVAQVQNELGHYAAALLAYRQYLAEGGDEVEDARRTEAAAEIERLATLVGTIRIETDAPGVTVFIDGKRQGETPLPEAVYADLGDHEVLLKVGTDELHREVVQVAGGTEAVVTVAGGKTDDDARENRGAAADNAKQGGERVWTWVALGVGAAAGITGGVLGGVALSTKNEVDAECVDQHCPPTRESDGDKVRTLALTADVLYGVAGAAVITGIVLFFVEPGLGQEDTVAVAPLVNGDVAGVAVSGRF